MRQAKSGGALYGEAPFGWTVAGGNRSQLVRDPVEQRIIAIVRHMHLVQREPLRAVVERLREMGIRNRRGQSFSLSRVWEMVHDAGQPARVEAARGRTRSRTSPSTPR